MKNRLISHLKGTNPSDWLGKTAHDHPGDDVICNVRLFLGKVLFRVWQVCVVLLYSASIPYIWCTFWTFKLFLRKVSLKINTAHWKYICKDRIECRMHEELYRLPHIRFSLRISRIMLLISARQKQKYRGMFETRKSRNKTSSGDIGLNIRTIASPKVGQDQVSGGVSVLCWHAAPVANVQWKPLAIR